MCHLPENWLCKIILWSVPIIIVINCAGVSSQLIPSLHDRLHGNKAHENLRPNQDLNHHAEIHDRQNFPFANNPGQQILERLRENLGNNFGNRGNSNNINLGNLGNPLSNNFGNLAGQAIKNTYNILNKTFENLSQLSKGNFGNIRHVTPNQPHFPNNNVPTAGPITPASSVSPINNQGKPTTPTTLQEDNISHYIDGKFPVILLKDNEVRK